MVTRLSPALPVFFTAIKHKPIACKACLFFQCRKKILDALFRSANHNARVNRQEMKKVLQVRRDATQRKIFQFS